MKKLLALVLTMALVFTAMGTTSAFAAEASTETEASPAFVNAGFTETGVMRGGGDVTLGNHTLPSRATFSLTISGNPDMYVSVTATNPLGKLVTFLSHIQCNGETNTVTLSNLVPGDYINFYIWWTGGSTSGQVKPYTFKVSW